MLKNLLSLCSGACQASHLLNLGLGIGAALTMTSPVLAQSSTIIYQRTTTYDNYPYPHVNQYIYGSPSTGQIRNHTNSLFPQVRTNLFPEVRVYKQPRVRQDVNDSTLFNPVLVNPNIRNSTIINPTIINNRDYRRPGRKRSVFMYSFP
jgi:hypothetical protein